MNILIIRRDNIGDLVCTTPLIHALRQRYPQARLCALVNSYNAGVLQQHPDVDQVYAYTKAKHRGAGESLLGVHLRRVKLIVDLWRERFDYAIAVGPGAVRHARSARPKHIIAFHEHGHAPERGVDCPVARDGQQRMHEVLDVFRLLTPLGIEGAPPKLVLHIDPARRAHYAHTLPPTTGKRIAIHLSAREASRRWPLAKFQALIASLTAQGHQVLLFWAPGAANDPRHPGDDEMAAAILAHAPADQIVPCPTACVEDLIAALSLADVAVCADGGSLHIAAGVGVPVVALFEHLDKKTQRWYPWGVPYVLVSSGSAQTWQIEHIALDAVQAACQQLLHTPV